MWCNREKNVSCSWFESLTANGSCLTAHPERVEGFFSVKRESSVAVYYRWAAAIKLNEKSTGGFCDKMVPARSTEVGLKVRLAIFSASSRSVDIGVPSLTASVCSRADSSKKSAEMQTSRIDSDDYGAVSAQHQRLGGGEQLGHFPGPRRRFDLPFPLSAARPRRKSHRHCASAECFRRRHSAEPQPASENEDRFDIGWVF